MGLHLGKRRTAGAMSADDTTMRPPPVTADTLVAHEERNKPWPEEKAGVAAESGQIRRWESSLSRFPPQNQKALSRKISQTPDTTVNLNLDADYPIHLYDDYDSDDGNNNTDNEILEVLRGCEGHSGMSTNGLPSTSSLVSSGMGRMVEIPRGLSPTPPTISPYSSILSPSLNTPLSPSPNSPPGSRSGP